MPGQRHCVEHGLSSEGLVQRVPIRDGGGMVPPGPPSRVTSKLMSLVALVEKKKILQKFVSSEELQISTLSVFEDP